MNLKTILRVTSASVMLTLGACADDTNVGADTLTGTGTGTGTGGDDGSPTTLTTAPSTMTAMGTDDTGTDGSTGPGPGDSTDGGPVDGSSSDGGPVDGSSSDGGPGDGSSSSDGGSSEEGSSSSDGGSSEEGSSSSDGGAMNCGNGAVDAPEECDGAALGGEDCISQGFAGGTLSCAADCTLDTSLCTAAGTCGDGAIDAGEDCDGAALGGQDCTTVGGGFTGGTLACAGDCTFDTSACTGGGVPAEWTCLEFFYDEDAPNEYCDCDCGAHDPDCDVPNNGLYCAGDAAPEGTMCVDDVCEFEVPAEWTCGEGLFDDGQWCDCSCGAHDPDCDSVPELPLYCEGADEPAPDGTTCVDDVCEDSGVPAGWMCDVDWYGDDACDCGCGIQDADCPDLLAESCQFCLGCNSGVGCPGTIDPVNNAQCTDDDEVPAGWLCSDSWYGDGECDCGCGVQDTDCADLLVGSCDFCQGPCNVGGTCPGDIDPVNNVQCTGGGGVPADWYCDETYYDDGSVCDCSCGAIDPDCDGTETSLYCGNEPADDAAQTCNAGVCSVPAGWTCTAAYYDEPPTLTQFCDCSCGGHDPDCDDPDQGSLWCNGSSAMAGQTCVDDVCTP